MNRRLLVFFFLLLPSWTLAEYRMFLLEVTSADGLTKRQVPSTLDPDQYRGYHIVKEGEKISYVETWMCKGRTNEMPPCPNPKAENREPAQTPAVTDTPSVTPPSPEEPTVVPANP